jgi:hypothetical protein
MADLKSALSDAESRQVLGLFRDLQSRERIGRVANIFGHQGPAMPQEIDYAALQERRIVLNEQIQKLLEFQKELQLADVEDIFKRQELGYGLLESMIEAKASAFSSRATASASIQREHVTRLRELEMGQLEAQGKLMLVPQTNTKALKAYQDLTEARQTYTRAVASGDDPATMVGSLGGALMKAIEALNGDPDGQAALVMQLDRDLMQETGGQLNGMQGLIAAANKHAASADIGWGMTHLARTLQAATASAASRKEQVAVQVKIASEGIEDAKRRSPGLAKFGLEEEMGSVARSFVGTDVTLEDALADPSTLGQLGEAEAERRGITLGGGDGRAKEVMTELGQLRGQRAGVEAALQQDRITSSAEAYQSWAQTPAGKAYLQKALLGGATQEEARKRAVHELGRVQSGRAEDPAVQQAAPFTPDKPARGVLAIAGPEPTVDAGTAPMVEPAAQKITAEKAVEARGLSARDRLRNQAIWRRMGHEKAGWPAPE